ADGSAPPQPTAPVSERPTPQPAGESRRPAAVPRSAPSTTSRWSRKRWVGLGVVVALVLGLVGLGGSEWYLRHQVTSCLANAFGSLTGAPTTVHLSGRPMLLQAMSKEIPFVHVDASGGDANGSLKLKVEDIRSSGDKSTIDKIDGSGTVPYDQIVRSAQGGGGGMLNTPQGAPGQIEQVRGNGDGTFDVTATVTAVIIPVPATVTIRPSVRDGKAHFEVVKASALMIGIPPEFAQGVVDDVTTATLGPALSKLRLTKLEATGDGIAFAVDGQNITVDENLIRPRGDCSDVTTAVSG
ncbi:DUF2993 domain-containing protein, partial [Gordonia sp. (in: high G+C Gram-positive bacteria)]|uniref:LmeA family phospholipid-binding protein n=1 Tax=Gordonia sp. (in: high G+C Gram-positive bacteria) TaxID=84139 RepID=UPI0039E3A9CF